MKQEGKQNLGWRRLRRVKGYKEEEEEEEGSQRSRRKGRRGRGGGGKGDRDHLKIMLTLWGPLAGKFLTIRAGDVDKSGLAGRNSGPGQS